MTYYYGGYSKSSYKNYCAPATYPKVTFNTYCAPTYKPTYSLKGYCAPVKPTYKIVCYKFVYNCHPVTPVEPKPTPKPEPTPKPAEPDCVDCVDDNNQNNQFGGIDKDKGNIINVVESELGTGYAVGTDGKDTIYGTASEDLIYGGDGPDVIYGGDGNDTLYGGERGDAIYGQGGKDYLQGGEGNDYLNGGAEADTMLGGDGNDVYYVDNSGDQVIEFGNAAGGIDTVRTEIDYTLPANVENLILQGMGDLNGTGNELNNDIEGNGGDNKLYGLAGDDCLTGKDGADYLDGGIGNDILIGGQGDDTYFFGQGYGHDVITDVGGDDTLLFGEGICASDLILTQKGDDLNITFKGNTDSILVSDWFASADNQIENFTFANGSTYEVQSGYKGHHSLVCVDVIQEQTQVCI